MRNRIELKKVAAEARGEYWCVSLCACDGSEIFLLSTAPDRLEAEAVGIGAAARRGISLFLRNGDGTQVQLYS